MFPPDAVHRGDYAGSFWLERGIKPQIGIRAGRMVRGRLRFCVGLGSEPDEGARTWPLWPSKSKASVSSEWPLDKAQQNTCVLNG